MKFASFVTAFVALALPGADADTKLARRRERANDELAGRRQQSELRSGFDRQLEGSVPLIGAEMSVPLLGAEISLPLVEAPGADANTRLLQHRERANDELAGRRQQSRLRSGFDRQLEGSVPLIGSEISIPLLDAEISLPLVEAPGADANTRLLQRRERANDELAGRRQQSRLRGGFDRQLEGSVPRIGAEISVPLLEASEMSLPLVAAEMSY